MEKIPKPPASWGLPVCTCYPGYGALGYPAQRKISPFALRKRQKKSPPLVYGSGGWLGEELSTTMNAIAWYLDKGCNIFKIRIGTEEDASRLLYLRKHFGEKIKLAVDYNQYFPNVDCAITALKMLEKFDLLWVEEPLFSESLVDLYELTSKSKTPIAVGENCHTAWQINDICKLTKAKIIQLDPIHQGGITGFFDALNTTEAFQDKIITSHLFHELSCSLLTRAKQSYIEHARLFPNDLFTENFSIEDGKIYPPDIPGHGLYVSDMVVRKYKM